MTEHHDVIGVDRLFINSTSIIKVEYTKCTGEKRPEGAQTIGGRQLTCPEVRVTTGMSLGNIRLRVVKLSRSIMMNGPLMSSGRDHCTRLRRDLGLIDENKHS